MDNRLPVVHADLQLLKANTKIKMKQDCGVQTDTHFIHSYWDPSYEWNEWVLRRKALQLADLCGKATRSTQTVTSVWRENKTSQVSQIRCDETQTVKDKSTSTPFFNI